MARTISILTDNRTADPDRFGCEHGLSVLLQTPSAKVLMDTGASGLFAVNAARMGIDLSDVDYVFLSHGHSDHIGGLKTFLKNALTVSALLTDVFNTRRWDVHSENPVFTLVNNSKNRSRMFWLGINWNFHSFKAAKGAQKQQEEDRSIIRLGD